jgi:hypothetical protein
MIESKFSRGKSLDETIVFAKNCCMWLNLILRDFLFKNAAHGLYSYHETVLYNSLIFVRRKFSWDTFPLKMLHMDYIHVMRLALYNSLIFVRRKVSWGESQDERQKCALQMLQVDYHRRQEYVYLKTSVVDPDPSIFYEEKSKKNLDFYCFVTSSRSSRNQGFSYFF